VVLIVLVLFLWLNFKKINPWFGNIAANWLPFLALVGGLYVSYYVLQHLPIIDFTVYKVGTNIPEAMEPKQGEDIPAIHDFFFENDTDDFTDTILQSDKVLLVIATSLYESNKPAFEDVKLLTDNALKEGYKVFALSASNMEDFQMIKEKYKLNFDMLYGDSTTLKTMVRANPGLMILKKGVITGKWNANDADKVVLLTF
jgi:hypothetical protein